MSQIVHFRELRQGEQAIAVEGAGDAMKSDVLFDLDVDGRRYEGLRCTVRQSAGSTYESDLLEVDPPVGYDGPFDYASFRDCVEQYYRRNVGSSGMGIRVEGASNVVMSGNTFGPWTCEPGADEPPAA